MNLYSWLSKDWQAFQSMSQAQAILLVGDPGIGTIEFARHLALYWLCQGLQKPCHRCESCQWFKHGTHPDFWEVAFEKEVGIEAIRQLTAWAHKSPYRQSKVALMPCAEKMTPSAASGLLKTLEEPPSAVQFLLTTKHISLLAPTIISRVQAYYLHSPLKEESLTWLQKEGVTPASFFLIHAHGLPLLAKALAQSDYRHQYQTFVKGINKKDYDILAYLPIEFQSVLELWQKWTFDLMWYHRKKTAVFSSEWLDIVAQEALSLSPVGIAQFWETLNTFTKRSHEAPLQESLQSTAIASIYMRLHQ